MTFPCHLTLKEKIQLINDLESKLIDVYIDSKKRRQTTMDDFLQ
jgi:hypothetical protein